LHEIADHRDSDGDEHEDGGAHDQYQIDELAAHHRPRLGDAHRALEPLPKGRHHPRRRPREDDQAHEPGRTRGRGDGGDRILDVLLPRHRHRERVDDRVHDVRTDAVVLKHEPEDRHEHDRERRDREQDPVCDPRRLLGTAIREEPLDVGSRRRTATTGAGS
jgi:hypothetical protein